MRIPSEEPLLLTDEESFFSYLFDFDPPGVDDAAEVLVMDGGPPAVVVAVRRTRLSIGGGGGGGVAERLPDFDEPFLLFP